MSEQETGKRISDDDPVAAELRLAVHAGDVEAIQRLLRSHPALAMARLGSKDSGTPLDAATGLGTRQENVITWLRGLGARSASSD